MVRSLVAVGMIAFCRLRQRRGGVSKYPRRCDRPYGAEELAARLPTARGSRLKADGSDVDALRILARASIRLGRDSGAGAAIYNDRLTRRAHAAGRLLSHSG